MFLLAALETPQELSLGYDTDEGEALLLCGLTERPLCKRSMSHIVRLIRYGTYSILWEFI